jgi:hypothetical protein
MLSPSVIILSLLDLFFCFITISPKKTPWPESASGLFRPTDRRMLAKIVSTFADREVSHNQSGGFPTAIISIF